MNFNYLTFLLLIIIAVFSIFTIFKIRLIRNRNIQKQIKKYSDLKLQDISKYIHKDENYTINSFNFKKIISLENDDINNNIIQLYKIGECTKEIIDTLQTYEKYMEKIDEDIVISVTEKIKRVNEIKESVNLREITLEYNIREECRLIKERAIEEKNEIFKYSKKLVREYCDQKFRKHYLINVPIINEKIIGLLRNKEELIILNNIIQYILKSRISPERFKERMNINNKNNEIALKIIKNLKFNIKYNLEKLKEIKIHSELKYDYDKILEEYVRNEISEYSLN